MGDDRFNGVHALRGVAAILVVLLHAFAQGRLQEPRLPNFELGHAGVDLFFLISGFVVSHSVRSRDGKPGAVVDFLKRRFVRIAPPYWIVTLALVLAIVIAPSAFPSQSFDFVRLTRSLLFFPTDAIGPYLLVGWTLAFEASFYLLWAPTLAKPRWRNRIVLPLLVAGGVAGLIFPDPQRLGFSDLFVNGMLLEFVLGVAAEKLQRAGRIPPILVCLAGTALAGYMLSSLSIDFRALKYGLPSFGFLLAILAVEAQIPRLPWILRVAGDASYSLYLLHWVVIAVWLKASLRFAPDLGAWLRVSVAIISSFIVAVLFHVFVEKAAIAAAKRFLFSDGRSFRDPRRPTTHQMRASRS